jgi:ABC-type multidrug transport system ATPase subunit/ABC-type transporter Mla maintaining outer membrane lipid asymmetry permease subunit MlaE
LTSSGDASGTHADAAGERGVQIRELRVSVAGRLLLDGAAADFPAGKVTLVIGASGTGKTVLMKILAGLLGPGDAPFAISGSIEVDGEETLGRRRTSGKIGILFQNFALFDEFSCAGNIEFAVSHRRRPVPAEAGLDPKTLLAEFEIPPRTPVRALSGGQQQRLALARTLAYDPPVLIYDEPTSGLDPVNARRVAERIRRTGEAHGKTTIVVTHDYEHLAGIADAVYLLDPEKKQLVRLSAEAIADLASQLPGSKAFDEGLGERPRTLVERALGAAAAFADYTGAALERALLTAVHLAGWWRSPRWGLRFFLHYLRLIASFSSWVYFAAAGLVAGFVSTHFPFKFLPHRKYTEPLIADELLNGLGFVLYRVVVPVLITVLIAARCGAAVASDVGNRSWSHQIDALRSFGARPQSYLLRNILYAFLAGAPFLVAVGWLSARFTSLVVFAFVRPEKGPAFWHAHFHRDLIVPGQLLYYGTGWLLAKVLLCGLGTGSIAYHIGVRPKSSGVEVSRGITSTIIWATLFVLAVHFAFAFFEFEDRVS